MFENSNQHDCGRMISYGVNEMKKWSTHMTFEKEIMIETIELINEEAKK